MRLGALLLLSRSCAWTGRSSRCYLRVLRASPDCICARILALQCCRQVIADILPHRRLSRCSEHCKRWDRAYRDRPALPRNGNNTSTEWSTYSTLLEGWMDFPLASWLEPVCPSRYSRSKSLCRGTSGGVVDSPRCGAYVTIFDPTRDARSATAKRPRTRTTRARSSATP